MFKQIKYWLLAGIFLLDGCINQKKYQFKESFDKACNVVYKNELPLDYWQTPEETEKSGV